MLDEFFYRHPLHLGTKIDSFVILHNYPSRTRPMGYMKLDFAQSKGYGQKIFLQKKGSVMLQDTFYNGQYFFSASLSEKDIGDIYNFLSKGSFIGYQDGYRCIYYPCSDYAELKVYYNGGQLKEIQSCAGEGPPALKQILAILETNTEWEEAEKIDDKMWDYFHKRWVENLREMDNWD